MKRYNHNTYWGRSTLHIALLTLGNFSSKGRSSDNVAVLQVLNCHSVCLLPSYAQMEDKCTIFLLTYRLYFQTRAHCPESPKLYLNHKCWFFIESNQTDVLSPMGFKTTNYISWALADYTFPLLLTWKVRRKENKHIYGYILPWHQY